MSCSFCKSDRKVVANGLCRRCYSRQRATGSLEYKKWYKPKNLCNIEGCGKPIHAIGLCNKHYISVLRNGDIVSPFGYGERRKHPLYETWRYQLKTSEGRSKEWNDFWLFVNDVGGEKPGINYRLCRIDKTKPWSKENFSWNMIEVGNIKDSNYQRIYRKKNPHIFKNIELKKRFGITLDEYLRMYEHQNGRCAICDIEGSPVSEKFDVARTLVVYHCHGSNKVRKLLCSKCNRGLGCFNDDVHALKKAVQYLEHHQNSVD